MQIPTTKFGLLPFEKGHIQFMVVRDREQNILETASPDFFVAIAALTVVEFGEDGFVRVLGVIGMRRLWAGVADVFLIPCNNLTKRNTIAFVRQVRNAITIAKDEYGIRRFQTVAVDDELHNRWLSYIGFVEEGLMKEYSVNSEDYKLWALKQQ
jgi:hypothetical protein